MDRRGLLFVVSAPSGAGKTTLCRELLARVPGLEHSISCTTRKPRPGEVNGREYYFLEEREFQEMVDRREFVEYANVYGHYYGTPRTALHDRMEKGVDVLLEIDVQGAMQIKRQYQDGIFIYILPPSIEELRQRLLQRGADSPEEIQRRMQKVRAEVLSYREYYYIVRNEDLTQAVKDLEAIVIAERIKTKRLDMGWLEENFIREKDDRSGGVPAQRSAER